MARKFKIKKKGKLSVAKKVLIGFLATFVVGVCTFFFLLYGPYSGFRNFWITSAMTTMSHQYLAKWFFSDKEIQKVLAQNGVIEAKGNTDTSLIKIKKYSNDIKVYKNKYEEQILKKDEGNDLYKVIEVSGTGYKGYLVAIYDPSRVSLATSRYLGTRGEAITTVAKNNNAIIAINGGGFYDPDWNSNGGIPHGIPSREVLEKYIKNNHLEKKVTLHGFRDKKYIYDKLCDASIYLMTSHTESFGIVLLEAMSCGLPCISFSSAEGANEIINSGSNGYLIKNRSFSAYIKKCEDLMDDFEARKKVGLEGRRLVSKYTPSTISKEWFKIIEKK